MRPRNSSSAAILDRKLGDVLTAKGHCAGARLVRAGQNIEQGRFAGAIRADDADRFTFADGEVDLVQDNEGVETLVD